MSLNNAYGRSIYGTEYGTAKTQRIRKSKLCPVPCFRAHVLRRRFRGVSAALQRSGQRMARCQSHQMRYHTSFFLADGSYQLTSYHQLTRALPIDNSLRRYYSKSQRYILFIEFANHLVSSNSLRKKVTYEQIQQDLYAQDSMWPRLPVLCGIPG